MNLPISSHLRCLRDPFFKRHEWHAGHLSCVGNTSPKEDYELYKRWKKAGKRSFSIIRNVKHYHGMQLTPTQKHMLYVFIRNELFPLMR